MAVINLPLDNGTGGFLVSEARGYRSREAIVVAKGAGKLPPGAVLARLTADAGDQKAGEFVAWAAGGSNGTGTFGAICYEQVDATAAAVQVTGIVRDAEVQRSKLALSGTPNDAAKAALYTAMSALGLALR